MTAHFKRTLLFTAPTLWLQSTTRLLIIGVDTYCINFICKSTWSLPSVSGVIASPAFLIYKRATDSLYFPGGSTQTLQGQGTGFWTKPRFTWKPCNWVFCTLVCPYPCCEGGAIWCAICVSLWRAGRRLSWKCNFVVRTQSELLQTLVCRCWAEGEDVSVVFIPTQEQRAKPSPVVIPYPLCLRFGKGERNLVPRPPLRHVLQ